LTRRCIVGAGGRARGIAEAIAELAHNGAAHTPYCQSSSEEGSGGGACISVADHPRWENSIYGRRARAAASILWRDSAFASAPAEAMNHTAPDLLELGLIEGIVQSHWERPP
jgi:acetyl-CoA carboxylase carboxyl transferase subunit alpha